MNTFSEYLRAERIKKNISLAEISAHTRINIKHLEAIDQGLFDVLPQTYIRSFLKQYALFVGLEPDNILKKYETMVLGFQDDSVASIIEGSGFSSGDNEKISEILEQTTENIFDVEKAKRQQKKRKYIFISSIIFVAIVILIYVLNFVIDSTKEPEIKETPFKEIIKEETPIVEKSEIVQQNQLDIVPEIKIEDANKVIIAPLTFDSLRLKTIGGKDTVWLNIKSDTSRARNYFLLPNEIRYWNAKEKFTITSGNPSGFTVELNGKPLGKIGKVSNFEVSLKNLEVE